MSLLLLDTRKALGLTQDMMAPLLGISRSALALAETGRRPLTSKAFQKLTQLQEKMPPPAAAPRPAGKKDKTDIRLPDQPAEYLAFQKAKMMRRGQYMLLQAEKMEQELQQAQRKAGWHKRAKPDKKINALSRGSETMLGRKRVAHCPAGRRQCWEENHREPAFASGHR